MGRHMICGWLKTGASGHETDKISPSSPPGTKLLAKGTNPDKKWSPLENDRGVSGQYEGFVSSVSELNCVFIATKRQLKLETCRYDRCSLLVLTCLVLLCQLTFRAGEAEQRWCCTRLRAVAAASVLVRSRGQQHFFASPR